MALTLGPGEPRARTAKPSKVTGISLWETFYAPDFKMRPHSHPSAFIHLILRGALEENCGRTTHRCTPSTVIFQPADLIHANHFLAPGVLTFSIELDNRWLGRLREVSPVREGLLVSHGGELAGVAVRLYQAAQETDAAAALVMEGLVLELLGEIARREVAVVEPRPPRWLEQTRELLHARFAESLTLEEIAAAAGVHPVHLASTFRRHYGCPVGDYVRRLRTDYAARELVRSATPLVEIALEAGFSDQSHFTRAFKRLTGVTPAEYRRVFAPRLK
jgi:AraC family transcriptional regulator